MCEQIVEKLNSNPVFAMSLHSKELFHSNFWAWLFGHNVEYAKIFFPDLESCKKIEREQKIVTLQYGVKMEKLMLLKISLNKSLD